MAKGPAAVELVAKRAALYLGVGASGIFVPGVSNSEDIAAIAKKIAPAPLNVMAVPNLSPSDALARVGVRRLSAGTAVAQGALSATAELASGFIQSGDSEELWSHSKIGYAELNKLFG